MSRLWFPSLDVGLVAQLALVHDAPEVYAGDTPTLLIDAAGRVAKARREAAAVRELTEEFGGSLPWFPDTIALYEGLTCPEARFVKAVDKLLPRIVHLCDGGLGLREFGINRATWDALAAQTEASIREYAGEFEELFALRAVLGEWITSTPGLLAGDRLEARVDA